MLPNLTNAVRAWTQPFTFKRVTKSIVDYQLVETLVDVSFKGVVAPFTDRELEIKPEGQRQWRWIEIYSTTDLALELDDIVIWKAVNYRVMASHNWEDYGYWRYEIAEAFT